MNAVELIQQLIEVVAEHGDMPIVIVHQHYPEITLDIVQGGCESCDDDSRRLVLIGG